MRIAVSDEGARHPAEARDKVFQPFFTTKSIGKGTGLGLPIAYGIVKMHRARSGSTPRSGRGTTFHVELPRSQLGRKELIDDKGATHMSQPDDFLFVDDDRDFLLAQAAFFGRAATTC